MVHIALIVLAGAVVYANTMQVPFVMDDRSIAGIGQQNLGDILLRGGARRVTDLTFALNYRFHAMNVVGYHIINLLVHLSASLALYVTLEAALSALKTSFPAGQRTAGDSFFGVLVLPFAVALLFCVHPIQTQAVTYVIQRYTSLASFFYMLSVLFYIKGRLALERHERRAVYLGFASLAAGVLAIGSKQIAVTLPLMLIFLELLLFRGRLINRRFIIACGGALVLLMAMALFRWHGSSFHEVLFDLRHLTADDLNISRSSYALTQARVVATYLRLLCLPIGQSLVHDYPVSSSIASPPVIAAIGLHLCLTLLALYTFVASRRSLLQGNWEKGASQRLVTLGIVWFYVALLVESSIVPIRDVINEHRVYLSSAGFLLALLAGTALAARRWMIVAKLAGPSIVGAFIVLCILTVVRNHLWRDKLALWQDTARKAPHTPLALSNLAGVYLDRGMPGKAIPLYLRALEQHTDYQELLLGRVFLLAAALHELRIYDGRFTSGEEFTYPVSSGDKGKLIRQNRNRFESVKHNVLGLAYEYAGEQDKAAKAFGYAVTLDPAYDLAWYNLGLLSAVRRDHASLTMAITRLNSLNPLLADRLTGGRQDQSSQ